MTTHTNTATGIDLAALDKLEALARAADPVGATHLITHYRSNADVKAEEAWRRAANPATVLELIALARRAEQTATSIDLSSLQKFGMAKLVVGEPTIYQGEFVRLSDVYAALAAEQTTTGTGNERPSDVYDFGSMIDPNASHNIRPRAKAGTGDADERAAFEAWYAPRFAGGEVANMPRRANGEYARPQAEIAWQAFRAALAKQAAAQPLLTKAAFEEIAESWDGCESEGIDDVGAALRRDFVRLATTSVVDDAGAQAATVLPHDVTLKAFQADHDSQWHVVIEHPFGTTWARMGSPRDVQLAQLIAATPPAAQTDDARDAARYRWLRGEAVRDYVEFNDVWYEDAESLDAAIDAALTAPDSKGTAQSGKAAAANAAGQPTVAWLIEWKNAAGGDRRLVSLHNCASDVRAEHGNVTITELVPRAAATSAPQLSDDQIIRIAGDVRQRNAGAWPGSVAFARAILDAAKGTAGQDGAA